MKRLIALLFVTVIFNACASEGNRHSPATPEPLPAQACQAEESLFDKCRALPEVQEACEKEKREAVLECYSSVYENVNVFVRYLPPAINKGMIIQQNLQAEPGWRYFVKNGELYVVLALSHALKIKLGKESLLPYAEETKYTWEELKNYQLKGLSQPMEKIPCDEQGKQYILIEEMMSSDNDAEKKSSLRTVFVNGKTRKQLKNIYRIAYNNRLADRYVFCDGKNQFFYFTGIAANHQGGVLAYNLQTGQVNVIRRNGNWPEVASNPAEIPNSDYFVYTVVRDEEPYSIELYTQQKLKQK